MLKVNAHLHPLAPTRTSVKNLATTRAVALAAPRVIAKHAQLTPSVPRVKYVPKPPATDRAAKQFLAQSLSLTLAQM